MQALVDGNSFHALCEKIFRPDWRDRPLVVLSNNDGCIVARCPIAKKLQVPDLVPYFQARPLLEKIGAVVCSSNYELYGDISKRMMQTLQELCGDIEVYSIDEAFLQLPSHLSDLEAFGHTVRRTVLQRVKMPNCVGIAPTKTLAKLANRVAKKRLASEGVCVLDSRARQEWALKRVTTREVWGVGARISAQLAELGIVTGLDLARADPKMLRSRFSVVLERTARELAGEPCLQLQAIEPKKQIISSRSFSRKITDVDELRQAAAKYASRACEKLRAQDGLTPALLVFVESSRFSGAYYGNQQLVRLDHLTNDSRVISHAAAAAAGAMYRPGVPFHKAGVVLLDLQPRRPEQLNFFGRHQSERSRQLMRALDTINARYGRGTIALANQGIEAGWNMARNMKSPAYTTRWPDLPIIQCRTTRGENADA